MERTMTVEEKIRRAEEIYARRQETNQRKTATVTVNNENKKDENIKFRLWQRKDKRRVYLSASYITTKPYIDLINNTLFDEKKEIKTF